MSTRAWIFTLNNPGLGFDPHQPGVQFAAYQTEIAPNTGTEHIQGYVYLEAKQRMSWLKNNISDRAHWEPRKGTHEQALAYSTKEDTRKPGTEPTLVGNPPSQGKRNDLIALQEDLDSPDITLSEVATNHFSNFIRYHKGIEKYRALKASKRSWLTYTTVYYGDSGTGKSYRAAFEAGPDAYYLPAPNSSSGAVWWDGYTGQENVVIDEFYGWIAHSFMLRICDRLPLTVQTKGGNVPFLAKRLWITSNKHPLEWWPRTGLGAMERRLSGDMGTMIKMSFGPGGAHWRPPALALPDPPHDSDDDSSNGF